MFLLTGLQVSRVALLPAAGERSLALGFLSSVGLPVYLTLGPRLKGEELAGALSLRGNHKSAADRAKGCKDIEVLCACHVH